TPVHPFDAKRYLGTWYTLMRLDHRFDRDLTHVTATYGAMDDGRVSVVNRGYDPKARQWRRIEGAARFLDGPDTASLAVTFFWPITGGYHVVYVDDAYSTAIVTGPTRDYLWFLARTPQIPEETLMGLVEIARANGFAVEGLTRVKQDQPPPA
ncbi:lipocalin, partial [Candidatus Falkowbacteria bacterium]|nr:lipocalin [Candidatus Falkowbacteria bacterium]